MTNLHFPDPIDAKNPSHYVDNAKFYEALKAYREECRIAKEAGEERPIIPNYIGACFLAIAKGVAMKHNFRNYSYIKDMQSAGVEVCIRHVLSFDPDRGTNPFSYYTTTIWYAFLNIIKNEKKESAIKRQVFLKGGFDTFDMQSHDGDDEFRISYIDYLKSFGDDSGDNPPPKKPKKPKIKPGALDSFIDSSK